MIELFGKSQRYLTPTLFAGGGVQKLLADEPGLRSDPRFWAWPLAEVRPRRSRPRGRSRLRPTTTCDASSIGTGMNGSGRSDRFVVPANPPDKAAAAEAGEERERTKGNADGKTRPGHSAGSGVSSALDRVRQVAVRDKEARFTALLHHVSASGWCWPTGT